MTVPVVGSLTRKPPWRFLPEIHATRFSVSGSLRPKIGLLILLVLLVLSAVLLVVPLISKQKVEEHADLRTLVRPGDLLVREVLKTIWRKSKNIVFSPLGLTGLLHLLRDLSDGGKEEFHRWIEQGEVKTVDWSNRTFRTNTTVRYSPEVKLSDQLRLAVELAGVRLEQAAPQSKDPLHILNTNSLKVVLDHNVKMVEDNFVLADTTVKRVPVLELHCEVETALHKDIQIVELALHDGFILQILLPGKGLGVESILDADIIVSANLVLARKRVLLRIPVFTIERETAVLPLLEEMGVNPSLVPRTLHNVTHQAQIEVEGRVGEGLTGSKGEENLPEEQIFCDRGFIFNILSSTQPIPLLTGVFTDPTPPSPHRDIH